MEAVPCTPLPRTRRGYIRSRSLQHLESGDAPFRRLDLFSYANNREELLMAASGYSTSTRIRLFAAPGAVKTSS